MLWRRGRLSRSRHHYLVRALRAQGDARGRHRQARGRFAGRPRERRHAVCPAQHGGRRAGSGNACRPGCEAPIGSEVLVGSSQGSRGYGRSSPFAGLTSPGADVRSAASWHRIQSSQSFKHLHKKPGARGNVTKAIGPLSTAAQLIRRDAASVCGLRGGHAAD